MSDKSNINSMESTAIGVALLGVMLYGAYQHLYFVWSYIWRILKLCQMFMLFVFENVVQLVSNPFRNFEGWGFKEGFFEILNVHYSQITPQYMAIYDGHFGELVKWPFAIFLVYLGWSEYRVRGESSKTYNVESLIRSASKVHPHLRRITPPNFTDKVLARTIGLVFPSFKQRLEGENPIHFSHDYDFSDRSSHNNRYAMGITPFEMLTSNPPLGITEAEFEDDKKMQADTGFNSNFRPICHFFFEEDATQSSIDFCMRTATICLERLLLMPLKSCIDNSELVARLFDEEGNLIPLEYVDKHGAPTKKLTKYGSIVSGFRPTTLLNDGNEYKGSVEDTILLFNEYEREILQQLKVKIDGKVKRSFEEILYMVVVKKHAYSTTVIWGIMELFQNVNRIAGNEFSWVKRKDRGLGMVMASIGRETPFMEASGVRAHYRMEVKAEMRLTIPSVLTGANDLHVNAERIINAGKKSEDLLSMSEEEFGRLFEFNKSDDLDKKENKATTILKSLGVDVGKAELWKDPYDDVPELMKKFEEENNHKEQA
ncbi:hypothetical protein OCT63_18840 [Vibrio sp. RW]|uniref:secretion/conjugation apparatus DotM-related subunit n=1 Tax=Vibrio sp. RW TaxID=2998833 RepID=UPI0022CD50B6|nr:hypothetical protein [Vibrio sp. RW]MDA0146284.1 hypothetical protein [Vibrio sp. RW]